MVGLMKKTKKYLQLKKGIQQVQQHVKGNKVLIIIGSFNAEQFQAMLTESLTVPYECIVYDKECTEANCKALAKKMKEENFDSIIGFGGGKILDIVKAVTYYYDCFLMVIPSSASMDGACSALSVLYHEDHSFDRFLHLPKNPDVVLVDTQIIFDAPFHLLCAGMADAISSYYDFAYAKAKAELEQEVAICAQNCYDIVFSKYKQAKEDFEKGQLSESVEAIIKVNVYDSAVAFENVGCEFSHVLANASTKVMGSKGMHGERVGVATLFQLYLEKKEDDFKKVKEMLEYLTMPTSISQLNIEDELSLLPYIEEEFKELEIYYATDEIKEALHFIK